MAGRDDASFPKADERCAECQAFPHCFDCRVCGAKIGYCCWAAHQAKHPPYVRAIMHMVNR